MKRSKRKFNLTYFFKGIGSVLDIADGHEVAEQMSSIKLNDGAALSADWSAVAEAMAGEVAGVMVKVSK